jgi:hypothetical protein
MTFIHRPNTGLNHRCFLISNAPKARARQESRDKLAQSILCIREEIEGTVSTLSIDQWQDKELREWESAGLNQKTLDFSRLLSTDPIRLFPHIGQPGFDPVWPGSDIAYHVHRGTCQSARRSPKRIEQNTGLLGKHVQISAMSLRLASESPSMSRWVMPRLAWPEP